MINSGHKITGILLAGGMSSRMGREKGSLVIGGRMMYLYPLKALEALCDEILISSSNPLPGNLPYTIVADKISGIGPMAGIYSCLEHSSNDLNLVLSYDLPLVNKGLLSFLVEQCDEWEMLVPAMQAGKPEPLCALYRKSMSTVFGSMIEKKEFAVHRAIPLVRSRTLHIQPDMPFYTPDLFLNINREEDLKNLPENLK